VEVELKSGDQNVAISFALALAERFGLKSQEKSKFRRALALAKGE
jgi:inorganic triphosphatase YgiF